MVTDRYNCHTNCEKYVAWTIVEDFRKAAIEREMVPKTYRHENYAKVLTKKHK